MTTGRAGNAIPAPPRAAHVQGTGPTVDEVARLADFAARHAPLFVISGAGCSTESGIFDYRGRDGQWKRKPPVQYDQFIRSEAARQRYWARSHVGWQRFHAARPNPAHLALAALERAGVVGIVVTQNVDGLHQAAGHERVIDLHGRLDAVICTACGRRTARADVAAWLDWNNPGFETPEHSLAPDGDADFEGVDLTGFRVPCCDRCGGVVKPDVVFFGENVPRARVDAAFDALAQSGGVLICGSSVMVQSSFRFCRRAEAMHLPVAALNQGVTRADAMLSLKVEARCGPTLAALAAGLG
ncbi:MAG: NAD-dependent protein deacetylase [Gammaproteobacteria bacterium]|nr:NAD-dependent protein deacetylase [Gammaproteobacteria bacterium]